MVIAACLQEERHFLFGIVFYLVKHIDVAMNQEKLASSQTDLVALHKKIKKLAFPGLAFPRGGVSNIERSSKVR